MLPEATLIKVMEAIGRVPCWGSDTLNIVLHETEIRDIALAAAQEIGVYYTSQTAELVEVKEKYRAYLARGDFKRKYIVGPAKAWAVADEILTKHGLTRNELLSKRNRKKYSRLRFEIYHAIYSTGKYGLDTIASILNRHHTSILHGINRWDEILQKEQHHD
jgi:hypothetical protein